MSQKGKTQIFLQILQPTISLNLTHFPCSINLLLSGEKTVTLFTIFFVLKVLLAYLLLLCNNFQKCLQAGGGITSYSGWRIPVIQQQQKKFLISPAVTLQFVREKLRHCSQRNLERNFPLFFFLAVSSFHLIKRGSA